MASRFDTRHWKFTGKLDFACTKTLETCKTCNGRGHIPHGFGPMDMDDDPEICRECHGDRRVYYDLDAKPKLPEGLQDALHKALREFEDNYDWAEYYDLPKMKPFIEGIK